MSKVGDESGKRDFQKIEFMGIYGRFDVGHERGKGHQDACAYDLGEMCARSSDLGNKSGSGHVSC